ncbi:cyclic lactone autoinducer peptide [Lacrimispora algidixylanolytica]|nr:cyclic lactone autoinducer peptide [Lacrimispora algidixylanolytica]
MKKLSVVMGNVVSALALKSAVVTSNLACGYIYYQPEMPKEAKKLRKF